MKIDIVCISKYTKRPLNKYNRDYNNYKENEVNKDKFINFIDLVKISKNYGIFLFIKDDIII